jgi:hypothetical protein
MISAEDALEIARRRAADNGWRFGEPFSVLLRRGWRAKNNRYEIETNAGRLGTKARFVIEASTGHILEEGYIPR